MVAPNPLFLRDADVERGVELLLIAEREIRGRAAAALERLGLSPADFRLLYFLARRNGSTVVELARLLGVSKQAVSRQLQRLIGSGRVASEPAPDDRRKLRLRASATARRLVEEVVVLQRRHLRGAYKKAGAEAVEGFERVLVELVGDQAPRAARRDAA
jgi:DNA-binding MarR family transcriptional regulator